MKPFIGSAVVRKGDGSNYVAFTPKENGVVARYDSEVNETTLIDVNDNDFVTNKS